MNTRAVAARALRSARRMDVFSVKSMLSAIARLSREEQLTLYKELKSKLRNEGLLPA